VAVAICDLAISYRSSATNGHATIRPAIRPAILAMVGLVRALRCWLRPSSLAPMNDFFLVSPD